MNIASCYPVLMVRNVSETADFYRTFFDFRTSFEMDWYVSLVQRSTSAHWELAIMQFDHPTIPAGYRSQSQGVLINIEVEDAAAEYDRLVRGHHWLRCWSFGMRRLVRDILSWRIPRETWWMSFRLFHRKMALSRHTPMSKGTLTALFGENLAFSLLRLIENRWSGGDPHAYRAALGDMAPLTLMQRVRRIAEALGAILPADAGASQDIMVSALPAALGPSGKTFNDGYWILPLAEYWPTHHLDKPEIALSALREITQRGTAEFAIRPFVEHYPAKFVTDLEGWVEDPSFHVRRLASEGTRPFLPWSGRLKVSNDYGKRYFEIIRALAGDDSSYVRRSVGNHARDWRRVDASVVEAWLDTTTIPQDVRKLAAPRGSTKVV